MLENAPRSNNIVPPKDRKQVNNVVTINPDLYGFSHSLIESFFNSVGNKEFKAFLNIITKTTDDITEGKNRTL